MLYQENGWKWDHHVEQEKPSSESKNIEQGTSGSSL
jgi:hypothetical protein